VVPERTGVSKERIWLRELCKYLHHSPVTVKRFAKRHGLLRRASGHALGKAWYVSPYGAQRIIAYIRAMQGDAYLQGREFHDERERKTEYERKRLAFPRAATEAEHQRSACAKAESRKPRGVQLVCTGEGEVSDRAGERMP